MIVQHNFDKKNFKKNYKVVFDVDGFASPIKNSVPLSCKH